MCAVKINHPIRSISVKILKDWSNVKKCTFLDQMILHIAAKPCGEQDGLDGER